MKCRECGLPIRDEIGRPIGGTAPRLEVVRRSGERVAWCASCCVMASYQGHLWNRIQAEVFLAFKEMTGE